MIEAVGERKKEWEQSVSEIAAVGAKHPLNMVFAF